MMANDNKKFYQRNLFNFSIFWKLRRWWFLTLISGDRGNMTRTLLFSDLAEAVRLKTPLDVALDLVTRGHENVNLSLRPFLALFCGWIFLNPDQMVRLLALHLLPLVSQGLSLSEAMRRLRGVFSRQEVQIVAMGERNGRLPQALQRLADYRQTDMRLQRILAFLFYPVYVAGLASVVISSIMVFILPKYQEMFNILGGQFPLPTLVMIEIAHLLIHKLYLMVLLGLVLWVVLRWVGGMVNRHTGIPLTFYIPLLSGLHRTVREARWLAALTVELETGGRADEAVRRAGEISGGTLERRSRAAAELIGQGHSIGEACIRCRVLDRWVNHRLQLIDWRGNTIASIRGIVEDMDHRVVRGLEGFGRRAEIFSILTVGVAVAFTVIAIYLPLFMIPKIIMGNE